MLSHDSLCIHDTPTGTATYTSCTDTLSIVLIHFFEMAEIAAGALVAEQAVTTTLEGGAIAGYAVAKPTVPLKATFSQIATADKDDTTYAYTSLILKETTTDRFTV